MNIVTDHVICRDILGYLSRKLKQEFREWLVECHNTLDQEILIKDEVMEKDRKVIKSITIMDKTISVGDYVQLRGVKTPNNPSYGLIKQV